jgi:hypothetical protein
MKYFLRILLVLVVAVACVTVAYYYTNGKTLETNNQTSLTTVTKAPATEKNSDRELLASLEDEDFYLYKSSDTIILTHNKKEYEYYNWSSYIDSEEPTLYYNDFDDDGEKELLVKAVCDVNESTKEYTYEMYYLDPVTDENGNDDFEVTLLSKSFYSQLLDEQIAMEISQLKTCNKIVQFAMNFAGNGIHYDKETGITKEGHAGYFSALQDSKGNYLTVDTWSKGVGEYSVDDDNVININVKINVSYKDTTSTQQAGSIHFKLAKKSDGDFYIASKSLVFNASDSYKVADPTVVNTDEWQYVENNADKSTPTSDTIINWVKYDTHYNANTTTQTIDFSSNSTEAKYLKSIEITNNSVVLTAKEEFAFDTSYSSGEFSVIINDEYNIAYTAELSVNGNNQIVTIKFDRNYAQNEINSLSINYGTK